MFPYFTNLNKRIISDDETLELRDFAIKNIRKFVSDNAGNYMNYINKSMQEELPFIDKLSKRFNIQTIPMLFFQEPHTEVIKHKDESFNRNTILMTPINPLDNYMPIYFWKSSNDTQPVATCNFENNTSILFNAHEIHSVINNSDEYRINLQFSCYENIEIVYKLYCSGQLLKEE
jgi:hypothetical protein